MDDEHRTKSDLKTEPREQRREERLELLLRERGRELKCLYDLSRLAERTGFSLEDFLTGAAGLLPSAWQYPDITCARVILDGREFSTEGFGTTPWRQSADIMVRGKPAGSIEVFYREAKPDQDEGPFSKEGRELLNAVAEQLGRTIERYQEVDTIRRQKEFLETIIESIATPFIVLDANDHTVRMANSAARQLGVLGKDTKCYELTRNKTAPCQSDDCPCPLGQVKATGKPAAVVHHSLAADGSPRYQDVRAYPVFNGKGRVEQVIEHMIDITERRQTVEALRKSQQDLALRIDIADIFLTAPEEEMYADVLGIVLKALRSKHGIFGYIDDNGALACPSMTREVWEQCRMPDKTAVFPRETWGGIWGRALIESKTQLSNQPLEVPRGHIPMNRALIVPIVHQERAIGLLEVANKDTDYDDRDRKMLESIATQIAPILHARLQRDARERDRKRAEDEILALNRDLDRRVRERTAELEAANRELESFAYSVSHDLRAPLRAIDGFSQALVEDYSSRLDQAGLDYLQRVSNAAQRMALLIDDLLELSRVTRAGMRREPVDLSAMARDVAAGIRQNRPQREVSLSIAEGLSVRGDPSLLSLALQNLLDNAFKFSSTKPLARIELGKMERDGETVYFVRDDGVGFDMAYVGKLFTPFQRLHSRQEFPGTGIGLATVQRIIHRHGGRVWAEGELDRGATFYFTLLHHERMEK